MRRRCDSDKCALSTDKLQSILPSIFFIFYRRRAAREQYFCHFIVTAQRGNNIFAVLSSPRGAGTIFLPFYRHRAARERYFAVLSSPRSAETIFLPFYRHRAAREQYLCRFIVTVQRGNNIFAILSSPRRAGTIFFRFIIAVQRSCKCICYASEKRADYPAKRQTNAA